VTKRSARSRLTELLRFELLWIWRIWVTVVSGLKWMTAYMQLYQDRKIR
jgi:hypothetical protein